MTAARTSAVKRGLRLLRQAVLWLLLAAVALVASTTYHVTSNAGRRTIAGAAETFVSDLLIGGLRVGAIDELTLHRVVIRDAQLMDARGQSVARLETLTVEFDPVALLRGEVHIIRAEVSSPAADLRSVPDGDELALVAAVMLADPSPDRDDSETSLPTVHIDEIIVGDLEVDGLPESLTIRSGEFQGRFDLDGTMSVSVTAMSAEVFRAEEELLTLDALDGYFDMTPGATSEAAFVVTAGGDEVSGELALEWTESGPGAARGELDLALSPALLDRLGIVGASSLVRSGVRGHVSARGTMESATLTANLETDGGPLQLSAEGNANGVTAEFSAADLSLGDIVPSLGDAHVGGLVRAQLEASEAGEAEGHTVTIAVEDLRYDEWVVPEVSVRGIVREDRVVIERVSIPHMAGDTDIDVTGHVTFDGSADVAIRARVPDISADANLAQLAPGVGGGVDADLTIRIEADAVTNLDIEGQVSSHGFRAPGLRAGHVDARGSVHGDARHPVVDLRVEARAIRAGDLRVDRAAFDLRGGPERYAATGTVSLPEARQIDLDASVVVQGNRYRGDAELTIRGLWPEPVRVALTRALFVPDRFVSAERLSAESTGLSVEASGRYAFAGTSELRATVATIDLHRLGQALGRALPVGSASGGLTFGGTPRAPELTMHGEARDLALGPFELPEISFEAALSSARREVRAEIYADAAGYGRINGEASGRLTDTGGLEERLWDAEYRVSVGVTEAPATLLSLASPDLPPFDGTMNITATGQGSIDAPKLTVVADLDDFSAQGIAPLSAAFRAVYEDGEVVTTVGVDDEEGPLVTAQGTLAVDLPAVARGAPFDFATSDLSLDLSMPTRRLDRLPPPFTVELAARASLEAQVRRSNGVTEGRARGRLMRYARALADEGCTTGPMVEVAYEVTLDAGQTVVELRGDAGGTEVGTLRATAATPVDDWIIHGLPAVLPAVSASSRIERLDLSRMPVVCAAASGIASLRIEAQDLLTESPRIDIEGSVERLALGDGPPAELRFAGGVDSQGASVDAVVQYDHRSIIELVANAPVTFGADGLSPAVADGPSRAELHLDRAPAQLLFGAVPTLAQVSGSLDGDIMVELRGGPLGQTSDFSASGEIELDEIAFIVTDPVVRIDGLNGAISLSDEGIELRGIRLRDRGGTLAVDGAVAMDGLTPRSLRAAIVAEGWNLRADGVVFASVDTELDVEAELGDEEREIRATFSKFSILMPEEMGHSVQGLEQHPDVIYEDQPGFHVSSSPGASPEEGDAEEAGDDIVPTRVIVDATLPFWIRRNDFSIQLTADLRIDSDSSIPRITGLVEVRRGFMNILGRAFDLHRGEIVFSGGTQVDPTLDLRAVHALQSRETVTVIVSGHLSDPRISFSTTVPGVETEAEIIDLLVSGHGGSSMDARDQMVSVIGAMTAGFISSMTRRTTGTYIPVMSIEAGSGGSTRIRAGVNADGLIPDFLEGIVESAYVEGFVGSSEQLTDASGNTSDTGAQGGFVIELYWPRRVVTTGSFEQPANWSFDVTWEP